jgi:hypothetical protein
MEEQPNQPSGDNFYHSPLQMNLPNSNTILVLGILSMVFCWWHILSIIGFFSLLPFGGWLNKI